MALGKKLDCVILGLLSHEELTGYEIKKRMDTALRFFWNASYGSIYPTLEDLVGRGLAIRKAGTDNGRNKKIYMITEQGRSYLKEWLDKPAERDELRYETLLKLFFGGAAGPVRTAGHIEAFRVRIEQELPYLLEAERKLMAVEELEEAHRYYLLTVRFGIRTYRAYLEWCGEAADMLKAE